MAFADRIQRHWRSVSVVSVALIPLSFIYWGVIKLRQTAYRLGLLRVHRFRTPVVVVGNLTVGGTGKTPFAIALAEQLKQRGWSPGIVSRGYQGEACDGELVPAGGDPRRFGDEPVLAAQKTGLPVAVARRRAHGVERLLKESVDVVISDDGLQHHSMGRSAEIAIIDGVEGFGNGFLLPAGPLREPAARVKSVDIRVRRGGEAGPGEYGMDVSLGMVRNLKTGEEASLREFRGESLAAVAGIHRPARFFQLLKVYGLTISEHPFPDHHQFVSEDLPANCTVLMTEKDAVKCARFADNRCWAVTQVTKIPEALIDELERIIRPPDNAA
jgi:tetraacyldisaccharide 4'-kinase